ncbi:MAG: hypothetical protein H6Q72_965 [Firmicutes bacterium]|nr:hypothetical protein [Bacillota bacterium]
MATIPSYERKVGINAPPTVRVDPTSVSANTYGQQVFQGMEKAAAGMQEYQDKQDTANVVAAKNDIQNRMTDLLYNKDSGLMFKEGAQANGLGNTFNTEFDKSANDIRKGLKNSRQQQAFDQYIANYRNGLNVHINTHEVKQSDVALADSFKNLTYTTSNSLSQPGVYRNPELVNTMLNDWEKGARATNYRKDDETISRIIATGRGELLKSSLDVLYKQDDVNGARDFIKLYGNQMDANTIAPYQGWVEKKDRKIQSANIADSLFSKYGVENERAAMQELKAAYGNSPMFDTISTSLQAKYVDERRYKADADKQKQESIIASIWKAGSLQEAQDIIDNADIKPSQKLYLLNQAKGAMKALAVPADSEYKQQAKHWATYRLNGGLERHMLQLREYYTKIGTGEVITPEQQTKYDYAASQVNNYKIFMSNGGFDPAAEDAKAAQAQETEQGIWQAINDLASKGLKKQQIIDKINVIAPKYGYKASYFIDNAEWDKQGNQKGGVQ